MYISHAPSLNIQLTLIEHNAAVKSLLDLQPEINRFSRLVVETLERDCRIFICGNGGSAADAQHFAAELSGRFERERRAYPAIALTTDTSALTSIGNDYGFEHIYRRQLEALGREGDMLIAMSTSGHSSNIIEAVRYAKDVGIHCVGLLGRDGGRLRERVDIAIVIPVARTARIQEVHMLLLHMICAEVDALDIA